MQFGDVYDLTNSVPNISGPILVSPTAPANPVLGTMWLDPSNMNVQVFNGGSWQALITLPPSTAGVSTVSLPGGSIGSPAGIGAAYGTLTTPPQTDVVMATYAGTHYIKVGAGTADGDWFAIGDKIPHATAAEIISGKDNKSVIDPLELAHASVHAHTAHPQSDAGKYLRLDGNGMLNIDFLPHVHSFSGSRTDDAEKFVQVGKDGYIDSQFIKLTGISYNGHINPTATYKPPTNLVNGAFYTASATGSLDPSWLSHIESPPPSVGVGDLFFYDGTLLHHISNQIDVSEFVSKAGHNKLHDDQTMTWVAMKTSPATPIVRLDGGHLGDSSIDNFVLDCGSY